MRKCDTIRMLIVSSYFLLCAISFAGILPLSAAKSPQKDAAAIRARAVVLHDVIDTNKTFVLLRKLNSTNHGSKRQ